MGKSSQTGGWGPARSATLIAGTGYLWAHVVVALADALCAFGVSRHWPEGASSFTTVAGTSNFLSSAKEGEVVVGRATPLHLGRTTQVWDAAVTNESMGRKKAAYRSCSDPDSVGAGQRGAGEGHQFCVGGGVRRGGVGLGVDGRSNRHGMTTSS
jgi:uncharacterized protein (TIGR00369 family)